MWYELATNKKMIDSMFPNGLPISEVEITNISIDRNDITISFNSRNIPDVYPEKWKKDSFNCIHMAIRLGDIGKAEYMGNGTGWSQIFEINSFDNKHLISVKTEFFTLLSDFKFLTIVNVTPYNDVRWK